MKCRFRFVAWLNVMVLVQSELENFKVKSTCELEFIEKPSPRLNAASNLHNKFVKIIKKMRCSFSDMKTYN